MPGAWSPDGHVTSGSAPFASAYADRKPAATMRRVGRLGGLGVEVADDDWASAGGAAASQSTSCRACSSRTASSADDVVEVGDDEVDASRRPASTSASRQRRRLRPRSSRSTSPTAAASGSRTSIALPYSGRPAQRPERFVAALARGADQPVLLERVDDLLEPEHVRLERGHVGEQQRQPLGPAVGEVADVERRDA